MLVESRGLLSDSPCLLKTEPGELDTWYSIYQFTSWFTPLTSDFDVVIDFRVDLTS